MGTGFKRRSYVVSLVFLVLMAGATYWMLLRKYPIPKLEAATLLADNWLLALAVLCAFGFIVAEANCFYAIFRSLNSPLLYRRCLSCSILGVYFSAVTPSSSGGQPAQLYYLNMKGIPVGHGTIALLLVAVIYKVVLLLFGLPLVFIDAPIVFIGLPYFRILFGFGIVVNVALIIGCLLLMFSKKTIYKLTDWVLRLLQKLHLRSKSEKAGEKFKHQLEEYHAAAEYLRSHRTIIVRVAVYTTLQRLLMFSVAYCVYRAFGLNDFNWGDILAIQTAMALAVDSLPLPGAVGAAEGVFLGLYRGIYGRKLLVPALLLTRGAAFYLPALLCGLYTAGYAIINALRTKKRGREV